jgi:RNA polymerase sigma-70 factor (ECF subfamily)
MPEEELFRTLHERFEQFALRRIEDPDDAKDVVQNALIVIAREYRQMDFKISFSAWAYKVLDIRILDYYKRRKRQANKMQRISASGDEYAPMAPPSDLKQRLMACLKKLHQVNRRYARIINLHYQGYQTKEICENLGLTPNALYVALTRARSMLKRCLESGRLQP